MTKNSRYIKVIVKDYCTERIKGFFAKLEFEYKNLK